MIIMRIELVLIIIARLTTVAPLSSGGPSSECPCGVAGLCLRDDNGRALDPECRVAEDISGGLYTANNELVDHCASNPCLNKGHCVKTFGSFYCHCKEPFYGKDCQFSESIDIPFAVAKIASQAQVYFQVQPDTNGVQHFTLIHGPEIGDDLVETINSEFGVAIQVSDRRVYFPTCDKQFKKRNVYEECLDETRYSNVMDSRVCDLLPRKAVFAYTIESTLEVRHFVETGLIYVDGEKEAIGRVGHVIVEIYWLPRALPSERLIFSENYTVFTYYHKYRNPCLMEFYFQSCSSDADFPVIHIRGNDILIKATKIVPRCKGIVPIDVEWSLQILAYHRRDAEPRQLSPFHQRKGDALFLPSFGLFEGSFMLQFTYIVRGNPPHASGDRILRSSGYCWFDVVTTPPNVHSAGGDRKTYPCEESADILLENYSPDFNIFELRYEVQCDRPPSKDPECEKKSLGIPLLTKTFTPCNEVYKYTVDISSDLIDPSVPVPSVQFEIYFIPVDQLLIIECFHNCFPNDIKEKTIWIATSLPYEPSIVSWTLEVAAQPNAVFNAEIIDSFFPVPASRIWRMDKNVFSFDSALSKMNIRASGSYLTAMSISYGLENRIQFSGSFSISEEVHYQEVYFDRLLFSETTDLVDNIEFNVRKFEVSKNESFFEYSVPGGGIKFNYEPIVYQVYQVHPETRGVIHLLETNYQSKLNFTAQWDEVCLCARDVWRISSCTNFSSITVEPAIKSVEILENGLKEGNTRFFMNGLAMFLLDDLYKNGETLSWRLSIQSRHHLMRLLNDIILESLTQYEMATVCYILSMMFYTKEGNSYTDLPDFAPRHIPTFAVALEWLQLRDTVVDLLLRSAEAMRDLRLTHRQLEQIPLGNIVERFIQLVALADIQSKQVLDIINSYGFSISYRRGEILFKLWRTVNEILLSTKAFTDALVDLTYMYYGVQSFGQYHMRLWIMRDTFAGIQRALENNLISDDLYPSSGFFNPRFLEEEWLRFITVKMPIIVPSHLYKEFVFIALATRYGIHDNFTSPSVYLSLRNKTGGSVLSLPNGTEFIITLPRLLEKEEWAKMQFKGTLENFSVSRANQRAYTLYKITLPTIFFNWKLAIFLSENISIKALVGTEEAPSYEDVLASRPLEVSWSNEYEIFKCEVAVASNNKAFVDSPVVYLGMMPTSELEVGKQLSFSISDGVDACYSHSYNQERGVETCKGFVQSAGSVIVCFCRTFGLIFAQHHTIRFTQFLTDPLSFQFKRTVYRGYIILLAAVFLIAVATLIFAFICDSKRITEGYLDMEDAYPNEEYPLLIGVFTGMALAAGTTSTVAIKVIGEDDSSKVHLLRSEQKKSFRVKSDNWFLMTTKNHLGRILRVVLWHNFHNMSDWYCSHLLIYDPVTYCWYKVAIKRWFHLFEPFDEARTATFVAKETQFDHKVKKRDIFPHYFRELMNVHHTLSVFTLNPRALHSHEQRAMIFIMKLLLVCCLTWIVLEFVYTLMYGEYLTYDGSDKLYKMEPVTFYLAFLISIFSTLAVIPFEMCCKIRHSSVQLQRKTTNPTCIEQIVDTKYEMQARKSNFQSKERQSDARYDSRSKKSRGQVSRDRISVIRKNSTDSEAQQSGPARVPIRLSGRKFGNTIEKIWMLSFSSSQFLQINVNRELLNNKMRTANTRIRITAAFILFGLFTLFAYACIRTAFSQKAAVAAFVIFLSMVIDMLVVQPLIIFFSSVITVWVLKSSNKEWLLVNDETRILLPIPLSYSEYLEIATGKDYKPRLTSDLEALKRKTLNKFLAFDGVFYVLSVLTVSLCCLYLLAQQNGVVFNNVRTIKDVLSSPYHIWYIDANGSSTDEVYDLKSAVQYMRLNFVHFKDVWYNRKPITPHEDYWARDRISKPLEAMEFTFGIMDRDDHVRLSRTFKYYFDGAYGYLSDSPYDTSPILLNGVFINFSKSLYSGTVKGKSDEFYSFDGHTLSVPFDDFTEFYKVSRILLEDVLYQKGIDHILRVIIVSTNFVNPYARILFTVHLVLEFLPSRLSSAAIRVSAFMLRANNFTKIIRLIMIPAGAAIIIIIAIPLSKAEFKPIAKKYSICVRLLIIFAIVVNFVTLMKFYAPNLNVEDELAYAETSEYLDMKPVYQRALWDCVAVSCLLLLLLIDMALSIRRIIGLAELESAFYSNILILLRVFSLASVAVLPLLMHIDSQDSGLSLKPYSITYFLVVPKIKGQRYITALSQKKQFMIGVAVLMITVLIKLSISISVYDYLRSSSDYKKLYTSRSDTQFRMIGDDWFFKKASTETEKSEDSRKNRSKSSTPRPTSITGILNDKFRMLWGSNK